MINQTQRVFFDGAEYECEWKIVEVCADYPWPHAKRKEQGWEVRFAFPEVWIASTRVLAADGVWFPWHLCERSAVFNVG